MDLKYCCPRDIQYSNPPYYGAGLRWEVLYIHAKSQRLESRIIARRYSSSFVVSTWRKLWNRDTSLDSYFMLFVPASKINPPDNEITSPTAWSPFFLGGGEPQGFQQPWRKDAFLVSVLRNCKNKFQSPIAGEPTDCLSPGNLAWLYLGNPLLRAHLFLKSFSETTGTSDASRI